MHLTLILALHTHFFIIKGGNTRYHVITKLQMRILTRPIYAYLYRTCRYSTLIIYLIQIVDIRVCIYFLHIYLKCALFVVNWGSGIKWNC